MRAIIVHDNTARVPMIAEITADIRQSFDDNYCFLRITQQSGKRGAGQAGPDHQYLAFTHYASRFFVARGVRDTNTAAKP